MRTSILTFQESNNNGALLQAYALQTILSNITKEKSHILNYHSLFKESHYKIKFNKNIPVFMNKLLSIPIQKEINRKAEAFKKRELYITDKRYTSSKEMEELNDKYDRFYCGSDQVWNPVNTGADTTYFLDFVKDTEKIVSYAPSIALSELPEELKGLYFTYINRFKHLSIREKSGKQIINELTGRVAQVVLDPTLLLDKNDWKKVGKPLTQKKPYIFVYYISYVPELIEFVKILKQKTGLEVIIATRTVRDSIKNYIHGFTGKIISPEDFVSHILNASYIVTNSFHGTVFSVNFEKEFFTFGNKKGLARANSRIIDFLDTFDLDNRFVSDSSNLVELLENKVNYTDVSARLISQRNESIDYIRTTLK